jgi:hypothetical protein
MSSGRGKVEDVTKVRYGVAAETATAPWPLSWERGVGRDPAAVALALIFGLVGIAVGAQRIGQPFGPWREVRGLYLSDMAQKIGVHDHEQVYALLCMFVHARETGLHINRERQPDGSTKIIYGSPGESDDVETLANLTRRFLRRNYELVMLDFYGWSPPLQTPNTR